jgi:hypothetical protein
MFFFFVGSPGETVAKSGAWSNYLQTRDSGCNPVDSNCIINVKSEA